MKRLIVIFLFISTLCNAQVEVERQLVLDNLNEAREDPQTYSKRYHDSLNVDLSMYAPMGELVPDYTLTFYAQWYSERLLEAAPVFNHSAMPYEESILWNYDVRVSIDQFIIDKNVPSLGHRRHMLDASNTKIGIGITKGWVGKWYRTYVVILTD